MNLIDRLELMAYNADSYRCMLTNGKVDEKHAAADSEAIETVRAMQEALRKMTQQFGYDVVHPQGMVHDEHEAIRAAMDALRRAEGNAG